MDQVSPGAFDGEPQRAESRADTDALRLWLRLFATANVVEAHRLVDGHF